MPTAPRRRKMEQIRFDKLSTNTEAVCRTVSHGQGASHSLPGVVQSSGLVLIASPLTQGLRAGCRHCAHPQCLDTEDPVVWYDPGGHRAADWSRTEAHPQASPRVPSFCAWSAMTRGSTGFRLILPVCVTILPVAPRLIWLQPVMAKRKAYYGGAFQKFLLALARASVTASKFVFCRQKKSTRLRGPACPC
jgi:hypothetical protein